MSELYKYPVYHLTKLTDIKPGRCRVLVRDEHTDAHYHTGGTCEIHHFGAGVFTPPRDSWSIDIDGCETVYRSTRAKAIKYVAAWWDKHLAEETGRPLSACAQRRSELAERGA